MQRFLDWLYFKLTHIHDVECTDKPIPGMMTREAHYWHIDECRFCDKQWQVVNDGNCRGMRNGSY